MVRRALFVLLVMACDQPWKPASVIDSLRVIGVRAEPPEVAPGQPARLDELLLDPTRVGKKSTTLWLGCDPDPFGEGRGACSSLDTLGDPTALVDFMKLPPGVHLIGLDDRASYAAAPNLFDVLDAGDPRRDIGTVGNIVSLAIAADVPITGTREQLQPIFDKVQSKEIASQLTLFRVRVSEADPSARNHNPVIDQLFLRQEAVPNGATLQLEPTKDHALDLTAHDYEEYDEVTPTATEHKTERIVVSWYTTAGRFDQERVALMSDVKSKLTAAGDDRNGNDPIPEGRRGSLWAVIRDSRGGQAWREWKWFLCDSTLPTPEITSVTGAPSAIELHGNDLDQILDVISDGGVVQGGYSQATSTWVGGAATRPLELRTKNCGRVEVP